MKALLALIIAAAAGYGLLSYHFVLLDSSLQILKKTNVQYENTFVDGRGEKKLGLVLKPDLISAGVKDLVDSTEDKIKAQPVAQ